MTDFGRAAIACAVLLSSAGAAAAPRSDAAPASFTTDNYELTARIPPGLFHCPYPPDWIGADHGIVIYLVEPRKCDPSGPTAAGAEATSLPRVTLFYSYNAADIDLPGGGSGPPRTNAQWLARECPAPATKRPIGRHLLGGQAVGCTRRQGSMVSLSVGTLYRQAPRRKPNSAEAPDSEVWVTLDTTARRASRDMVVYFAITDGLRVCRSAHPANAATLPGLHAVVMLKFSPTRSWMI